MVAAPGIHLFRRQVVHEARRVVRILREQRRPVWNHIGKESASNRRFVESLGFRITPLPSGPFDLFELRPCHFST
jgi:hypothetical protein